MMFVDEYVTNIRVGNGGKEMMLNVSLNNHFENFN
jgi:hypothetical protein